MQSSYPLEFRTPPLPLVALIGCAEVHKDVADFFVHHLRPPLVSLFTTAEATEQFIARNFGKLPMHVHMEAYILIGACCDRAWQTSMRDDRPPGWHHQV